ncbi:MhpC Predicted hydrolases or acyltransferases (alpha/beta hydrolase superfamily) [actinobacterium SCGC AAA044-D11]
MNKPKLAYQSYGSLEPIVLIHGLGSAATAWKPIIPKLETKFKVITLDLPGHGNADWVDHRALEPEVLAKLVFDLMDENGIDNFHLAGNSLGGWVALEMAALNPERIKSLVGLAPAGLWQNPATTRARYAFSKVMADSLKGVAPKLLKVGVARKIGFEAFTPNWSTLDLETCIDAVTALGNCHGYYHTWDAMLHRRFDKAIPKTVPTTIIFGDSDWTLPVENSQERSLAPAHCRWVVLPVCGHAPMWDRPDEVVSEIFATAGVA